MQQQIEQNGVLLSYLENWKLFPDFTTFLYDFLYSWNILSALSSFTNLRKLEKKVLIDKGIKGEWTRESLYLLCANEDD